MFLIGQSRLYAQYQQSYAPAQSYAPSYSGGYSQPSYFQPYAPQPSYQPPTPTYPQQSYAPPPMAQQQSLDAGQLEQLVAPIALYPDTLIALVMAASTYPAQVSYADRWRQAQGNADPNLIVAGANAQPWDPSIKALTAFPQVLSMMDQNQPWTTQLGNAYYNQPQDLLQAVQVMRQRAQSAGNLQNTPQEAVSYNQGYIQLAPADPQMVYVPSYDPWTVYGDPVTPYPGFSLLGTLGSVFGAVLHAGGGSSPIGFGMGILTSVFNQTPWGWVGWGLNWLANSIFYNHSNYFTHSTTVADWGLPHGGPRYVSGGYGGYNRYAGYSNWNRQGYSSYYGRSGYTANSGYGYGYRQPERSTYSDIQRPANYGNNYYQPARTNNYNYSRPQAPGYGQTYNRIQSQPAYNRPAYSYGSANSMYNRTATGYSNIMQAYRGSAPGFPQSNFAGRSYAPSTGKGFSGYSTKPEHSSGGGFHLFGGGHSSESFHAPKSYGGGGHSSGGGFHPFGGGHSGGGHGGGSKHHR